MERIKNHSELHNHNSIGSLLDGMGMPDEIMKRSDELGLNAYAITDHGTEFALYYFAEIQNKYKAKIIYGIELYEAFNHLEQDENNKYFHLLALAKTQRGIQALHQLTTKGEFEGKYYKPRVDLEQIKEFKDDLIIGSACLGGKINKAKSYKEAKQYALEYKNIFGDNFYLELQAHLSEDQIKANKNLMQLHYELDVPYIITSDSHYVKKEDSFNHSQFINVNRKNADTTITNEIYENCYLHSTDEMYEIMMNGGLTEDEVTIGLQNTNIIADLCKGKIEFHEPQLPKVVIPNQYKSQEEYFMALILQGWEDRNIEKQAEEDEKHSLQDYKDRLIHEFNVIKQMHYIDYHLIVGDYMQFAVNNKIPTAPGRGSGAGSLINYLLKITNINPLKYDLLFERYLNVERVSLPDIDSDFSSGRREEVFKYLQQKYGVDYVAQIINLSKYTPKVAIADACKMCNVPMKDTNAIKEFMVDDTIDECIKNSKGNTKLKELINTYTEMFELAKAFENRIKTTGTNACFLENELVMTNNGYKKIKDIVLGDKVLTHTNTFKNVVNTMIRKSDDIYELKIGNTLPIKVTGNHPFWVRKKIMKGRQRTYSTPEWTSVTQLDKDSMMGIAINNNSIIPNNNIELPYESKDFWWIIGRYIGDGWCEHAQQSHRRSFIICCDKTNKDEVNEIIRHLDKFDYRCEESRTTYKIYIKSRKLYDYVQQFGKYAHGKKLTNDIFDLPIYLLESFLDGYLSADGHYDKKEDVQVFKTVSKKLALGLSACINKVYKKHCGITVLKPKIEYIEGRKIYSKEKYQCRFAKDKRVKDHAFYEDGYIWTPFKEINKINKLENVYNITVEDDSSYTVNNIIVHNCGTVISSKPIYEYCGMKKGDNGEQLLQVDKVITEKLGMVKCDVLGTTVLQIIDEVLKTQGIDFYTFIDNISFDDEETYNFLEKGLYYGVFQLGSYNMTKFFMNLKPRNLEDICLGISAYRPGSMKYVKTMVDRKNGIEPIVYDHPLLEDVLKNTYAIPVYQEQVMQMLQVLAGFSYAQADLVRRGMAKKKAEYVLGRKQAFVYGEVKLHDDAPLPVGGNGNEYEHDERVISYERAKKEYNENQYDVLIEGCVHKGIDEQLAIKIYTDLEDFALYGLIK